jgi:bifunctional ADP-heptose synthase (sugar kinase/adenylyltransferase)
MNIEISTQKLNKIFNKSKNKRIAVVGDVMLDKYVYGEVSRISPEAPVQVVDIKNVEYKLGGAANVANNIKSLEAEPI